MAKRYMPEITNEAGGVSPRPAATPKLPRRRCRQEAEWEAVKSVRRAGGGKAAEGKRWIGREEID